VSNRSAGVRPSSPAYHLLMLVLCLFALGVLAIQTAVNLDPQVRIVLEYADYAVCVIFFADFLISWWRAPERMRYLATWGWLDLLSSIPTLSVARWGRIGRVVRIFRVLRGLRATKLITTVILKRRAQHAFVASALLALLLIVFCSIAMLEFETAPESNIKTAEDAVWWSFATITTVGYGDRYPVTPEGRFIAVVLMCAGVGLFGTLSGFFAAWFLETDSASETSDLSALRDEIAALRRSVENMASRP
jgi:voltage-gated potassium channel